MKRFTTLLFLALMLSQTAPAFADVVLDELLVRRKNGAVNIRVKLYNPESYGAKGPFHLEIAGRSDPSSPWESLKTWNNIGKLAPGHRVARDYFDPNSEILQRLSGLPSFEIRAVLNEGDSPSQEMVAPVQDE
jgi:hypothetical protein